MATELYDLTVPAFLRGFSTCAKLLTAGEVWAKENGISEADLLGTRLIADMHPLPAQVQRMSDTAKLFLVRVAGAENVAMPDDEASFADLHARIDRTVAFIKSVPRADVDGREEAPVSLPLPTGSLDFTGRSYATGFVLPNFYFHLTTAYALLRMRGVPIGKRDYLGG
ncbi:DUF1993 domain-containing protein [Sphingomonas gilva]|uniref:DUF1993 domain-containing protein n=1 Tax=Sphingomonas gilva TaxID=2305907 RepID=A0A396RNK0_9SPHN|nr:DUF1993 domain-containing protein [Sphingomonas gilva]RHW18064.1 DUF1993 domain-containing protein [Sphingomonas gilva]